jgi:hypothetical protein
VVKQVGKEERYIRADVFIFPDFRFLGRPSGVELYQTQILQAIK